MGYKKGLRGSISDLVGVHSNCPATIVGGAPCVVQDLKKVSNGSIFLSANDHGIPLRNCHYTTCCEDIEGRLRAYSQPVISRQPWADYRVFDKPLPNSAVLAAWAAWIMGCAPIILTGIECFTGKTYYSNPNAHSSGLKVPLKVHLKRWECLTRYAKWGAFRSVSGPLLNLFPLYDPDEIFAPIAPVGLEERAQECQGTWVKFNQATEMVRRSYSRDEVAEVTEIEAHTLVRKHWAKRVGNQNG